MHRPKQLFFCSFFLKWLSTQSFQRYMKHYEKLQSSKMAERLGFDHSKAIFSSIFFKDNENSSCDGWESNPCHKSGRRALQPLSQPWFSIIRQYGVYNNNVPWIINLTNYQLKDNQIMEKKKKTCKFGKSTPIIVTMLSNEGD